MKFQKGFTLIELMMAVAIIAILTMIAIPSYQSYVARSARATAQADLMAAAATLERRKSQNFSYIGSNVAGVLPTHSPVDAAASDQRYALSITMWNADNTVADTDDPAVRYELTAVSSSTFPGEPEAMKINERGQRCYRSGANTCTIGATDSSPVWP